MDYSLDPELHPRKPPPRTPVSRDSAYKHPPRFAAYTEGTPTLLQKTQIKSDMAHSTSGHHDITIVVLCCALHKRLFPLSSQESTAYEVAAPKKPQTVVP